MKIAIYGMNYAPERVGVGRYTGAIGRYLSRQGHEVTVVTTPPHYPGWIVEAPFRGDRFTAERIAGVRVIRCPLWTRRDIRGFRRLLAPLSFALSSAPAMLWIALRWRPAVVLCVEPTLMVAPVGRLAARLVGARTVLHVQDLEVDAAFAVGHLRGGPAKRLALWLERWLLGGFDRVVSISERMRDLLAAKGVAPDRLALVRNWVDLAQIRPLGRPSRYRTELGIADDAFVVLYAGSIGAKQALSVVLEAAAMLASEPRLTFVVAGDGPDKQRLAAQYGHLTNLHLLPIQPEDRLCELLNLADLHVLPQQRGIADLVLPSKLGGMLASGKPILVTADPGTELHSFLQGTATFVAAGDSGALARAIRELVKNPADRATANARLATLLSDEACLSAIEQALSPPLLGAPAR